MINIIKSADRYHADHGWLQTHWHFSFGDYYDPTNMAWGPLHVSNDDIIAGGGGFPPHPHKDMEIITLVLDGALEHKDNLGSRGVIRPGEVQIMSAGSGIQHAEYNHSKTDPAHLLQLWIMPRHKGLKPRWEQKEFGGFEKAGGLTPVVSSGDLPGTLTIDQDATIYQGSLTGGQTVTHASKIGRKVYVFVIQGNISVNGVGLAVGDQGRIADEPRLELKAGEDARFVLLDLPA